MASMLEIKNLHVGIENKEILKGISIKIKQGELHAIMGPNGSGKSTLSNAIMGHPRYKVLKGDVMMDGESILDKAVNERAKMGLFLGFQYPMEIPGVGLASFLRTAMGSMSGTPIPIPQFTQLLKQHISLLRMEGFERRHLNEGFSGGEKKRSEILQMALLKPKIAILDEPDSGLDVDSLKTVAESINEAKGEKGILLITHYEKILEYVKPDFIHIMVDGKIVKSGDASLAKEIEKKGYEAFGG